jgi:hypothetical protein
MSHPERPAGEDMLTDGERANAPMDCNPPRVYADPVPSKNIGTVKLKIDKDEKPTNAPENAKEWHLCISIEGLLTYSDRRLSHLFTDSGKQRPGAIVRQWLKLQLAQGKRVLPFGKECEGFSYQTGCPGHSL